MEAIFAVMSTASAVLKIRPRKKIQACKGSPTGLKGSIRPKIEH